MGKIDLRTILEGIQGLQKERLLKRNQIIQTPGFGPSGGVPGLGGHQAANAFNPKAFGEDIQTIMSAFNTGSKAPTQPSLGGTLGPEGQGGGSLQALSDMVSQNKSGAQKRGNFAGVTEFFKGLF